MMGSPLSGLDTIKAERTISRRPVLHTNQRNMEDPFQMNSERLPTVCGHHYLSILYSTLILNQIYLVLH